MKIAFTCKPVFGEIRCGDFGMYRIFESGGGVAILGDVTGHGSEAGGLANDLVKKVRLEESKNINQYLHEIHDLCSGRQGCAAGVLQINDCLEMSYAGVGNIRCYCFSGDETSSFVSRDGVLGQRKPSCLLQKKKLKIGDLLMMYSDGVGDLNQRGFKPIYYESLEGMVHRVLHNFGKHTDDMSCMGVKV